MILLELAAQGVRGVAPPGGRATLRPGYNVIAVDGVVMRRLIEALLYPDPRDADTVPRAAPAGPGQNALRAGLTLVGNDSVTYRLVRDFSAGTQLHRLDPEKKAFTPVSADLSEIGQFLRSQIGVPARGQLDVLFGLSGSELPSRLAGAQGGGGSGPKAAKRPVLDPGEASARMKELKEELAKAKTAEKLQYQLDGLQNRAFKIEETLKSGEKVRAELEAAESALQELSAAAAVSDKLGDVEGRVALYEKSAAKRDEATAKLADERAQVDELAARGKPQPLLQNPQFLAGIGAGVLALLAGIFLGEPGDHSRYLALLDIPAFFFAAFVAIQYLNAVEGSGKVQRRAKLLEEREKKVAETFERETYPIREALHSLNVSSVGDLRDVLLRVEDARRTLADRRQKLEAWRARPDTADSMAQKAAVESEIRDIEGKLSSEAGGYVRDPRSVEMDIRHLEEDLAAAPAPVANGSGTGSAPAAQPTKDTVKALLERAAQEWGSTPGNVGRGLSARIAQYLLALSGQRLGVGAFDEKGALTVSAAGKSGPFMALPAADQDLCYLAVKMTVLERALSAGKTVAIADDAFSSQNETIRKLAARMLKQMARPGQLLHATADPAFREAADHAI